MKTLRLALLATAFVLLAACSGGAATTANGNPTQQARWRRLRRPGAR